MNEAPDHPEVLKIVAPNPGPMTLEGTNTYVFGSDPCVVIDPGSADAGHLDAIRAAAAARGGIGLVLLTHSHGDHTEGADQLDAEVVLPLGGEEHFGLRVLATVWDDIPIELLPMAAMAMEAHLEKLESEGRLPGELTA